MRIQNPVAHHPILSGVKFAIIIFLVPLYSNGLGFGDASFWSWYGWFVMAFYPIEILCLLLFVTGNSGNIDSDIEHYSDQFYYYEPYYYGGVPYIYDVTNPHTAPFLPYY